jgi:flavin-dependent dehydrogenase
MKSAAAEQVAVVGGSAAGLYTAQLLAARGRDVAVFESEPEVDPAPRTLIVTSRMRDVVGDVGDAAVVNAIRRFELFTDGRAATIALRQPDLVIERATLIRRLAEQARAAGARLVTGRRLRALRAAGDGAALVFDRDGQGADERAASTVVGADGAFSTVAREAGWPAPGTVPLVQATVALPKDMPADTTRVWFIPDDTPYFYWLIPDSASRGVVGLIGEDGRKTRQALDRFLVARGLEPLDFQAARIPVYTRWVPTSRRVGGADVFLVGDAACHVKVTTVGGIVTGFRGAAGVADSILTGRPSPHLRVLRRELDRHRLIRRALHRFRQRDYSRLVDLLGPNAQRVLSTYTRDEANSVLVRLIVSQPRLALLGLRSLVMEAFGRLARR